MAKIRINFSGVQRANQDLAALIRQMEQLESSLSALRRQMDPDIQSRHRIAQSLKSSHTAVSAARTKARRLHGVVASGVDRYRDTEAWLSQHGPDNSII